MPSDARTAAALAALTRPRETFRSAVAATLEDVRVYLDTHRAAADDRLAVLAAELGPLGARHIDVQRLAGVLGVEPAASPAVHAVMARALEALAAVAARGDEGFVLDVAPGESLYTATMERLADLGRGIGAARVADAARSGRYRPSDHDGWLIRFPFTLWSQAERAVAPPLVIEVDGTDLRPAGLAECLDGGMRIVLVARGDTSPAPLVRLVTPRTFVAQAADASVVARLAAWSGPGIVALVSERSARFVHDPAAGATLGVRLGELQMPELNHRKRSGGVTVAQQTEELEQLRALHAGGVATAAPAPPLPAAEAADPVDKLAAWLLQQADL
ncbi:MAG: hypothetical protein AB1635_04560 [Acidobacteriota bacterium]